MQEKNKYPKFYKSTESQPTPGTEQLTEASQTFNELFDDLMLQDMDKVESFESIKGEPYVSLRRRIQVEGHTYSLSLVDRGQRDPEKNTGKFTFRDSEIINRDISLQRFDEKGYVRESWSYRLGADGIVRRWDGGDRTAKRLKEKELGIERLKMPRGDVTSDDEGKAAKALLQIITDELPNIRLSEDMGLNNQPVTPDEMQGLQIFLNSAIDIPKY
jgi:hypothetical protein